MCGRFTITVSYEELTRHLKDSYHIESLDLKTTLPRYNIAPGQEIISVINDGTKNRVGLLKWGFVPSFAKDEKIGFSMINAKAETLSEKAAFKDSFVSKRCVVLADSFYEWRKDDHAKIPMRILVKDQKIFSFAGLFTTYIKSDGTKLHTVTLITTEANQLMKKVHDRMPVILSDENQAIWLDPSVTDVKILNKVLMPYPSDLMEMYQVSKKVNVSSYDDKDCILKVEEQKSLFHM
jgi:putative SOS response-associated peptidase YedK